MKSRRGFVSNSSTSSFCIYGTSFDLATIKLLARELNLVPETEQTEDYVFVKAMDAYLSKNQVAFYPIYDWDAFYVGKSLRSMRDDQTLGDFKREIKEKLQSVLKRSDFACGDHEESYQ